MAESKVWNAADRQSGPLAVFLKAYWGATNAQAERMAYESLRQLGLPASYGEGDDLPDVPLSERGFGV